MNKKDINVRSRAFMLVLYPDNENHKKALEEITKKEQYYAYILHDLDIDKDGNSLKPHYHVIIKYINAHYKSALCDSYNIESNLVDSVDNLKASLLYLIHWGNKDKTAYNLSDVHGTLYSSLEKYLHTENEVEDQRLMDIVNLIKSYNRYITFTELLIDVCSNGYYADYRRGYSIIKELVFENNAKFVNVKSFENSRETN